MTPNELLKFPVKKVSKTLSDLAGCNYDFFPEISNISAFVNWQYSEILNKNEKIEIRYYIDHCYDGRRVWRLGCVYFENIPFMFIQNAGRSGDDKWRKYLLNIDAYFDAVNYIFELLNFRDDGKKQNIIKMYNEDSLELSDRVIILREESLDVDLPELTNFYGDCLETFSFRYDY